MIDWNRLGSDFSLYPLPDDAEQHDFHLFDKSLVRPLPDFVRYLFDRKRGIRDAERMAATLYFFLLDKRYDEKLNLLHFAFHIFDDETHLPDEVIGLTPFPHEDGIPHFRHFDGGPIHLLPESVRKDP